mmetsp:Transcript_30152/g.21901  ORF Transcript_30152/g.21901 Transcript_30152/m.21901 type:complete len:92 (+) Transcript_30152:232-507(+)
MACIGVAYIVHTASPFPLGNPRDPMEIIGPAVDGTKNIMVEAYMQKVKRVVITSSAAAIEAKNQETFTEEDWSDINHPMCTAYFKSKILAE